MGSIEKYQNYLRDNEVMTCVFDINSKDSLMFIDEGIKVKLDEPINDAENKSKNKEEFRVVVSKIDLDNNTVFVKLEKPLDDKIEANIEQGKEYRCKGKVIKVSRLSAYVDIEESGVIGVISANSWRKNAYIRSLSSKCKEGDVIEACVVGKQGGFDEMGAKWRLSRESITTDPWEELMTDVWCDGTKIDVLCVEKPKGKTYWWGICKDIEDIEITCDYTSEYNPKTDTYTNKYDVELNSIYRCVIREMNKERRVLRASILDDYASEKKDGMSDNSQELTSGRKDKSKPNNVVISSVEDTGVDSTKKDTIQKSIGTDREIMTALDQFYSEADYKNKSAARIRDLFKSYSSDSDVIPLIEKVLKHCFSNKKPEIAYDIFKAYRGIIINTLDSVSIISIIGKQLCEKGENALADNVYDEIRMIIKKNVTDYDILTDKPYSIAINNAVKHYVSENKYSNLVLLFSVIVSKIKEDHLNYNFEYARLYYYKGLVEKDKGEYASAKSNFYFCQKYANKIKSKKEHNAFGKLAKEEMGSCSDLLSKAKATPQSSEEIIDKYYAEMKYEEAHEYALKVYNDNPEDQEIAEIYKRANAIFERYQNRNAHLQKQHEKGLYYVRALAAETIEINWERAEKLWEECIQNKEPGILYAVNQYVSILCREGKYDEALEAYDKYCSLFNNAIELYTFRIKLVNIYRNIGAFDKAVAEGLKIEEEYSKLPEFLNKEGRWRLAQLLHNVATFQSRELGSHAEANNTLERARQYGLDTAIFVYSFVNNCILLGQYERVEDLLNEYEADLSSEYIASTRKKISEKAENSNEEFDLMDSDIIEINELFFNWYIKKNTASCLDSIKTYFEKEEYNSDDDISQAIAKYDNYDTNKSVKMSLNVLAAGFVLDKLDGCTSETYYKYLSEALSSDIELRANSNKMNMVLYKYAIIAALMAKDSTSLNAHLKEALIRVSSKKETASYNKYIAVVFNNNPILKAFDNNISSELYDLIKCITKKDNLNDSRLFIESILNDYAEEQSVLLEKKSLLLSYIGSDNQEAHRILVELSKQKSVLLPDDETYIIRLIEITRSIMSLSNEQDYLRIDAILLKTSDMIEKTRIEMEDSVTSLCLLMWFEILNKFSEILKEEKNRINVALTPNLSITVDDHSVYPTNGIVTVGFLLKNEENCAPARGIKVTFVHEENSSENNVEIDKLLGGAAIPLSQSYNYNSSFTLNVRILYKDNMGLSKESSFSDNITVNLEKEFKLINNPFSTIEGFDPDEKNRVFVGRDDLIRNLCAHLIDESYRCIALRGQKRTGKSTIFKKLKHQLSGQFYVVEISMSGIQNMESLYKHIKRKIWDNESNSEDEEDKLGELYDHYDIKDMDDFVIYLKKVKRIVDANRFLFLIDEFADLYDAADSNFPQQVIRGFLIPSQRENLFSTVITGKEMVAELLKKFGNEGGKVHQEYINYIDKKYFRDLIDKPIYDGSHSRFDDKSIERLWQLTKGHPFLSQDIGICLVDFLNNNKIEKIHESVINKVVEDYINNASELVFESFYCKYNVSDGEHSDEVNATKRLLVKIAKECSVYSNHTCDKASLSLSPVEEPIFADLAERKVIITDGNRCEIYVGLLYEWLNAKRETILQESYEEVKKREEKSNSTNAFAGFSVGDNSQVYFTQSNGGDAVTGTQNKQTNISITVDQMVDGLSKLQTWIDDHNGGALPDDIENELKRIPTYSNTWSELDKNESESKTEEFADKIFSNPAFIDKELTPEQKERFCLDEERLKMLSPDCRAQIISGIQVYDLIDKCIKEYGLDMSGSESPRGILFARAFEKHMKDCMFSFFIKSPDFKSRRLQNQKTLSETGINKTTIGSYEVLLKNGDYNVLSKLAEERLNRYNYTVQWWDDFTNRLGKIRDLRNKCCHSGFKFASYQLEKLKEMIFDEDSIAAVYVFKEMELANNTVASSTLSKDSNKIKKSGSELKPSLIGKTVEFVMKEKTGRGSSRGIVQGKYPGSLSPTETARVGYEVDKSVQVVIKDIQDGKYVLAIPN